MVPRCRWAVKTSALRKEHFNTQSEKPVIAVASNTDQGKNKMLQYVNRARKHAAPEVSAARTKPYDIQQQKKKN